MDNNIIRVKLGEEMVKLVNGHVYSIDTPDKMIEHIESLLASRKEFDRVTIQYRSNPRLSDGYLAVDRYHRVGIAGRRGVKKMIGVVDWGNVKMIIGDRTSVYKREE